MKIRTDFVTNSSSYSSAEVIIDNPVLLEILQKYKDMGTFDPEYSDFSIGKYEVFGVPSTYSYEEFSKTPAIYAESQEDGFSWLNVPESLSDVLECILDGLRANEISDEDLFEQMETELEARSGEIKAAYKRVRWSYQENSNEGNREHYNGYILHSEDYEFDPIEGEEFNHRREAGYGRDEQVKEGFIYSEKRIIDGKIIVDFRFEPEGEAEDVESDDEDDENEDE